VILKFALAQFWADLTGSMINEGCVDAWPLVFGAHTPSTTANFSRADSA